jgi:hypothetical protein
MCHGSKTQQWRVVRTTSQLPLGTLYHLLPGCFSDVFWFNIQIVSVQIRRNEFVIFVS